MARTIGGAFEELKSNLEITGLQTSTVSTRQQNVRTAVEKDFTLANSFLIGSYKRHTMIAPLKKADIDVFVVVDDNEWSTYSNAPSQLLTDIRTTLRKTYPDTPTISKSGQAVTITFTDFKVDVVPAFQYRGDSYVIPDDERKQWLVTAPEQHSQLVTDSNTTNFGKLVPLIKMIKQWNRHNNSNLRSFYLEMLAVECFIYQGVGNYDESFHTFIQHALSSLYSGMADPSSSDGYIKQYDEGDYSSSMTLLQNTNSVILQAWQYETSGQLEQASREWRKIFGDYFPVVS